MTSKSPTMSVVRRAGSRWRAITRDTSSLVTRSILGHELLEVVVGQIVERELQGGAPDLLAGLEAARVAARQRRDAERELVGGDRTRAADAGDLADRFADGRRGPRRLDADLQHERPGQPAELERGARPVGEALVLAQVQVDAADELSAEDRVGERRARGSPACRGRPRPGRCAAPTAARAAAARRSGAPSAAAAAAGATLAVARAVPVAERIGGQADDRRRARSRRPRSASPPTGESPARETRARRRRSSPRATVSLPIGEWPYGCAPYSSLRNARSATAPGMSRSCVSRCSRSWRTRAKSCSLSAGRTTMSDEQRERVLGEAAEDGDARDRGVRPDVGVELRAEPGERLVHLDRGAVAAALVEHVGGHRGQALLARRIGRGAAAHEQRERDQRHLRVMHGPHAQAVRAASTSRWRETGTVRVGPGSGSRERSTSPGPSPAVRSRHDRQLGVGRGQRRARPAARC